MKKTFLKIFFMLLFFLFISLPVLGADVTLNCNSTNCTPVTNSALFPSTEIWYPGKSLSKTVNLSNISGDSINVDLSNANTSTTGDLDKVINLKITRSATGIEIFNDKVYNFYGKTIGLPVLSSGSNEDYVFTAMMEQNSGNEYQDKVTTFDLLFNFTVGSPPPSNVSAGTVAGVSASVCSDKAPGSAPTIRSVTSGVNSITLNWSEAKDPASYYLIAYGTSPGVYSYGNTNVGGKGTTSYTISGISGGVPYYLVVRAGNGCAPGPFSGEVSTTPGGGFIAGVPSGFLPGVLGEATKEASLKEQVINVGAVKGETSQNLCENCKLLWSFIIEVLLSIAYFRYLITRLKNKKIYSLLIPVVTYFVFYFQNKNCITDWLFINSPNLFCKYFPIIIVFLYGLALYIFNLKNKKTSSS